MKKIIIVMALIGAITFSSNAQVKTPQPSPAAKIEQTVGVTDIAIAYSRPGVKGREIFGDLVPFGKVWRTGANKAVQFSASTAFKIEGQDVPAGNYALYTVPNKDSWDIILYEETEIWGTPDTWVDSLEAVRVSVKTMELLDLVESFTISIDNLKEGSQADLNLYWANTKVTVKIETPTEELVMKTIEATMAGPSANDYYRSATFYLDNDKDLNEALIWIKKAVEMRGEKAYWYLRKQSLIEAKLGLTKDAIATAERSLASAEKAGNEGYVKMNKDSIAEWSK
jgi:hypothetical protein